MRAMKGHVIYKKKKKNWGEEDDQGAFFEQVADVSAENRMIEEASPARIWTSTTAGWPAHEPGVVVEPKASRCGLNTESEELKTEQPKAEQELCVT